MAQMISFYIKIDSFLENSNTIYVQIHSLMVKIISIVIKIKYI